MRKLLLTALSLGLLISAANASGHGHDAKKQKMRYQAVPMNQATLLQKGDEKNFCPICGMTLPMFYKTNHAATGEKAVKQYCSIHCLMEDKIINKSKLKELKVVDNTSKKFINVEDAFYVIGSNKPATMAMVSKYAFATKEAAQAFAKENGGEVKGFDAISKIVAAELKKESAMIAKRQKKMQMMGEKVYTKMCKKTDENFTSTAQAKSFVNKNKLCGNLKGKNLQAVGIYLSRR